MCVCVCVCLCVCVCVCVCVCYGGREGSGTTLMVIAEGGNPKLELNKDQRKLLSLVLKEI